MRRVRIPPPSSADTNDNHSGVISQRELECNTAWNGKRDLRPGTSTTGEFDQPSNSRGSLQHARQAPVSLAACLEHLRVDSTSVIANAHAQATVRVHELEFDAFRLGVTKCVDERLPANPVNLLPDGWRQRLLPAGDSDAKINLGLRRRFLPNKREGLNQIRMGVGTAETLDGAPALLDPLAHDLQNPLQPRFDRRVRRYVMQRRGQVQRSALDSLQKSIVELPGNSRALVQTHIFLADPFFLLFPLDPLVVDDLRQMVIGAGGNQLFVSPRDVQRRSHTSSQSVPLTRRSTIPTAKRSNSCGTLLSLPSMSRKVGFAAISLRRWFCRDVVMTVLVFLRRQIAALTPFRVGASRSVNLA